MDYYVLEKEEDSSKCGMLDLGKCIDGSNDSAEENVFTATSSGNDSREGVRGVGENTSRGSDYHGEETRVVESEDHIMQFISGTPEVGSTGFQENPDSQMEKNMNECDSATDSMLKEIIDMNVVGVNQTEKVSQSSRENKQKMVPVQPVLDPSSTDEDSSKSLVSSDTPSDPKKTKTLDDILDDFCDENSDTITSQTSSTSDTDDSGSLASKNPLFEVDKVEDDKVERDIQEVATEENKIEDNLQKFVEHEQDISFQKSLDDNKIEEKMIEETVEEEYNVIQESDVNSKDLQGLDSQKSRVEEEDIHDGIYDKEENSLKFSDGDPVNNTTSSTELPQRIDCYEESNDWEAEDISKNNKTAIESYNMPLESAEKDEEGHSEKNESENTNNLPTPDSENRTEEMKNYSTPHSPIKKRGLKLARHNINTGVIESQSVLGDLSSENSNKRDMGDSENNARKKLRPDTDIETKYDERGVHSEHSFDERGFPSETGYDYTEIKEKSLAMEDDEPMADGNNQMEEVRENCGKALESTVIGFEMDLQIRPQSENMDLQSRPQSEYMDPQIRPQSENMNPQIKPQSENEALNGLHVEDTEDSSHVIEDTSNKEAEILKTNDIDQEKTAQSEELRQMNSCTKAIEEDEEIEKESDSHIEDSYSSTKETDERQCPHIKDAEVKPQKHKEKAEIASAPSRYDVSSEDSSSYAPEHGQETTDDAYADFDEENIENISRTIRSFTNEKLSPKKQEKTTSPDQKEVSPSKKVIMVKTAPNVEKVKRKLEEILEKSKGEEDAAIAELQRMKKEKTDILNAITTEMEKLKSMLVKGKQG